MSQARGSCRPTWTSPPPSRSRFAPIAQRSPDDLAQTALVLVDAPERRQDRLPHLAAVELIQLRIVAEPELEEAAQAAEVAVDLQHRVDPVLVDHRPRLVARADRSKVCAH